MFFAPSYYFFQVEAGYTLTASLRRFRPARHDMSVHFAITICIQPKGLFDVGLSNLVNKKNARGRRRPYHQVAP
jgi:hypothetical protein